MCLTHSTHGTLPHYQIIVPIIAIHHNEKLWPEPLAFKPERFNESPAHPFAWLGNLTHPQCVTPKGFRPTHIQFIQIHSSIHKGFINGPRACLGQHFALCKLSLLCFLHFLPSIYRHMLNISSLYHHHTSSSGGQDRAGPVVAAVRAGAVRTHERREASLQDPHMPHPRPHHQSLSTQVNTEREREREKEVRQTTTITHTHYTPSCFVLFGTTTKQNDTHILFQSARTTKEKKMRRSGLMN